MEIVEHCWHNVKQRNGKCYLLLKANPQNYGAVPNRALDVDLWPSLTRVREVHETAGHPIDHLKFQNETHELFL